MQSNTAARDNTNQALHWHHCAIQLELRDSAESRSWTELSRTGEPALVPRSDPWLFKTSNTVQCKRATIYSPLTQRNPTLGALPSGLL